MASFDDLPCGCLRFDEQRTITGANTEAARLLDCSPDDLVGQLLSTCLPIASRLFFQMHVWAELLERGQLDEVYVSLHTRAGRELPVLMSARRVSEPAGRHYVCVFQPMRRRHLVEQEFIDSREAADRAAAAERVALSKIREVEAQMALQERLASIGTLAAGVAHEINNPLTFVLSNLHLVKEHLLAEHEGTRPRAAGTDGPGDHVGTLLDEAYDGLERIRSIVLSLRGLSRFDHNRIAPVDIGTVLANAHRLCAHEIKGRAALVFDVPSPAPVVAGDEARLVQVFVNLLVNAAQAMPERPRDQNRIVVRTRIIEHTGPHAVGEHAVARIEVEDNGCGIPPDVQSRIFDPFFTTKAVGVGTGLGLSVCHSILTSLGGRIEVASVAGEGSAFRVLLPLAAATTHAPAAAVAASPTATPALTSATPVPAPPGAADAASTTAAVSAAASAASQPAAATARVLVIDDEELVVVTIKRMLSAYDVTTTTDGADAVRRLLAGEHYDVIFCDLMMPGTSGMDVHDAVMQHAPAVARRIIFMTGGTFTANAGRFLRRVTNEHVEKPFDPHTLREVCARSLAARAREAGSPSAPLD